MTKQNTTTDAGEVWPKAFVRMTDPLKILVFHSDTGHASWRDRSDGAVWSSPYYDIAHSAAYKPCDVPPVDHSLTAESIAVGYMRCYADLQSQLTALTAAAARWNDGTLVDEAWLREKFGKPSQEFDDHLCWFPVKHIAVHCVEARVTVDIGCQKVMVKPTRSQLLHLLTALAGETPAGVEA